MPIFNFANLLTIGVSTLLFILVLWFAHHGKKSMIVLMMLFIFVSLLILSSVQLNLGSVTDIERSIILRSIVFESLFVLISFISYLWIDDIECKERKKKSISNGLDWFWKKV